MKETISTIFLETKPYDNLQSKSKSRFKSGDSLWARKHEMTDKRLEMGWNDWLKWLVSN